MCGGGRIESGRPPFLTRIRGCDSEGEENDGINRSDYQGGLMVLTVSIDRLIADVTNRCRRGNVQDYCRGLLQ